MRNYIVRAFTVVIVLFVLSACAYSIRAGFDKETRVIKVCILNDKEASASEEFIKKITSSVFKEYEENVRVRFVPNAFSIFDYDPDVWHIELGPAVKQACSVGDEIRMIFTNKVKTFFEDGQEFERAGLSHEYYGTAIVFNISGRYFETDLAGNPALETTLKHEIGHLFGLDHTKDRESFMFSPGNKSYGKWTDETRDLILENKYRTWY